jgi:hypothetical protein
MLPIGIGQHVLFADLSRAISDRPIRLDYAGIIIAINGTSTSLTEEEYI